WDFFSYLTFFNFCLMRKALYLRQNKLEILKTYCETHNIATPVVVPFTCIVTPGMGKPSLSTTTPEIFVLG
ncbi:MAG: hypothetical protein LBF89_06745, partial [Bacteroidales bacterium]|nr:hypothetical protein [Bacteroidales bacterium]